MQPIVYDGQEFYESVLIPNYLVSRNGDVYGIEAGRLISQSTEPGGYRQVGLFDENSWQWRTFRVHRLVATQFLPNPEEKYSVNHIDGNKTNNRVENLEWATMSEQQQHAADTGLKLNPSGPDAHKYGTVHSARAKAKMSAAKLGTKHPKFKGFYCTPAGRFASPPEAGRANNTNPKNVYRWCLAGKTGWSFEEASKVL